MAQIDLRHELGNIIYEGVAEWLKDMPTDLVTTEPTGTFHVRLPSGKQVELDIDDMVDKTMAALQKVFE